MKMEMKKNRTERYNSFSVVINPEGGQDYDWEQLSKENNQYLESMRILNFINPKDLGQKLNNFSGIAQNSKDPKKVRLFRILSFLGQLEKGSDNQKPHYNLILNLNVKIRSITLVQELSKLIYGKENSQAIQVEPTHNENSLSTYCVKEKTRLSFLNTEYYPPQVDFRINQFLEMIDQHQDLLKSQAIQDYFKK